MKAVAKKTKPIFPTWRHMHPDWLALCNAERELEAAKTKHDKARAKWDSVATKEMAAQAAKDEGVDFFGGDEVLYRVGKKHALRLLDGCEHSAFPSAPHKRGTSP